MLSPEDRRRQSEFAARMIAQTNNGLMGCAIADLNIDHDDAHNSSPAGDPYAAR